MSEITLVCLPHGRPLFVGMVNDTIRYYHEDRTPCPPMNSYQVTADELLMACALKESKPGQKPSVRLRAAFIGSPSYRFQYYGNMAQADDVALERYLKWLMDVITDSHKYGIILWELHEVFGGVIFENLAFITGKMLATEMKQPEDTYALPDYPDMVNLRNPRRNNKFLAFEEFREAAQQKWWES